MGRGGVPPRRSQRDVSAFQICIRELALGAHALLGDQQHSRADDQNRAEDVEDGGADAAGGGSCAPELFTTSVDREPSFTTAVKVAVPEVTLPLKSIQIGDITVNMTGRNGKLDVGNRIVARGRGGLDQLVVAIIQATPGKGGHVLTL